MKVYLKILDDYKQCFVSTNHTGSEFAYGESGVNIAYEPMGMVDPYDPYNREILEKLQSYEEAALSRHQWRDHWHLTTFIDKCEWWEGIIGRFEALYEEHDSEKCEKLDREDLVKKQESPDRKDRLFNISSEVVDITPRFTEICLFDGHTHPNT